MASKGPEQTTAASARPLSGVHVLDLTRNVAGPFASMILADMGAEVIKVEQPGVGDDTRHWGPPFHEGEAAMFLQLNRNKRSIELDLRDGDSAEVMRRLVARSDVVLESFRPAALEALGFGYDWASTFNPRVVYASVTGFGPVGPMRDNPGYDPLLQAYSGLMSITGEPDGAPIRVGFSVLDLGTGMWTASAVLAALHERAKTGNGTRIVSSLYETALSWAMLPLSTLWAGGGVPGRYGSGTSTIVPYSAYATRDGHVLIAAGNDRLFGKLATALQNPEWLNDERFATNPDRVLNRVVIDNKIAAITVDMNNAELVSLLTQHGIPCSLVRNLEDAVRDPQTEALAIFRRPAEAPGALPVVGLPVTFDGQRPPVARKAPRLGEHTEAILSEIGLAR